MEPSSTFFCTIVNSRGTLFSTAYLQRARRPLSSFVLRAPAAAAHTQCSNASTGVRCTMAAQPGTRKEGTRTRRPPTKHHTSTDAQKGTPAQHTADNGSVAPTLPMLQPRTSSQRLQRHLRSVHDRRALAEQTHRTSTCSTAVLLAVCRAPPKRRAGQTGRCVQGHVAPMRVRVTSTCCLALLGSKDRCARGVAPGALLSSLAHVTSQTSSELRRTSLQIPVLSLDADYTQRSSAEGPIHPRRSS